MYSAMCARARNLGEIDRELFVRVRNSVLLAGVRGRPLRLWYCVVIRQSKLSSYMCVKGLTRLFDVDADTKVRLPFRAVHVQVCQPGLPHAFDDPACPLVSLHADLPAATASGLVERVDQVLVHILDRRRAEWRGLHLELVEHLVEVLVLRLANGRGVSGPWWMKVEGKETHGRHVGLETNVSELRIEYYVLRSVLAARTSARA
jgi:hypothetical protein